MAAAAKGVDVQEAIGRLCSDLREAEFLRTSCVLTKIIQNVLNFPSDDRFRRIRRSSQVLGQQCVVDFFIASGFASDQQGQFLICPADASLEHLQFCKRKLIAARQRYPGIDALEVPVASLKSIKRIGKGKFGEVYRGTWDDELVALKTLVPKASSHAADEFRREARVMSNLKHSNVLALLAVALTVEPPYLVMDLMEGCFLDVLQDGSVMSQGKQLESAVQVAAGMEYIHHSGYIHCDLAARNILVGKSGVLKISDFGLAREIGSTDCNLAGKDGKFPVRWLAPEVFLKGILSPHSDVWSFGIVFFEIVTAGSMPYGDFSNALTKKRVAEGFRLPAPQNCPDSFYEIMRKCWAQQPTARPQFKDIMTELMPLKVKYGKNDKALTMDGRSVSTFSMVSVESDIGDTASITSKAMTPASSGSKAKDKGDKKGKKRFSFGRGDTPIFKVHQLARVYTLFVTPLKTHVILSLKKKYKCSDVIGMTLKALAKDSSEQSRSQYSLIEVKLGAGDEFISRFVAAYECPLSIKDTWTSPGKFLLCHHASSDPKILEAFNGFLKEPENASLLCRETRGYMLKFDEYRGGTKTLGRRKKSNWQRFWAVLDGSTLLFYREEEEEENGEEPVTHLDVREATIQPALDFSKKRDVIRLSLPNGNAYLLHVCSKDDVLRWLEAVSSAHNADSSSLLEKFGDGDIFHSGNLTATRYTMPVTAADVQVTELGRQWFMLRGRQLLYFVEGERYEALDLHNLVTIAVTNPTANPAFERCAGGTPRALSRLSSVGSGQTLLLYSIRMDTNKVRFILHPDTPGDLDAWVDALDKLLLKLGKRELLVPIEDDGDADSLGSGADLEEVFSEDDPRQTTKRTLSDVVEVDESLVKSTSPPQDSFLRNKQCGCRLSVRRPASQGFTVLARLNQSSIDIDETALYDQEEMNPRLEVPPNPPRAPSPAQLLGQELLQVAARPLSSTSPRSSPSASPQQPLKSVKGPTSHPLELTVESAERAPVRPPKSPLVTKVTTIKPPASPNAILSASPAERSSSPIGRAPSPRIPPKPKVCDPPPSSLETVKPPPPLETIAPPPLETIGTSNNDGEGGETYYVLPNQEVIDSENSDGMYVAVSKEKQKDKVRPADDVYLQLIDDGDAPVPEDEVYTEVDKEQVRSIQKIAGVSSTNVSPPTLEPPSNNGIDDEDYVITDAEFSLLPPPEAVQHSSVGSAPSPVVPRFAKDPPILTDQPPLPREPPPPLDQPPPPKEPPPMIDEPAPPKGLPPPPAESAELSPSATVPPPPACPPPPDDADEMHLGSAQFHTQVSEEHYVIQSQDSVDMSGRGPHRAPLTSQESEDIYDVPPDDAAHDVGVSNQRSHPLVAAHLSDDLYAVVEGVEKVPPSTAADLPQLEPRRHQPAPVDSETKRTRSNDKEGHFYVNIQVGGAQVNRPKNTQEVEAVMPTRPPKPTKMQQQPGEPTPPPIPAKASRTPPTRRFSSGQNSPISNRPASGSAFTPPTLHRALSQPSTPLGPGVSQKLRGPQGGDMYGAPQPIAQFVTMPGQVAYQQIYTAGAQYGSPSTAYAGTPPSGGYHSGHSTPRYAPTQSPFFPPGAASGMPVAHHPAVNLAGDQHWDKSVEAGADSGEEYMPMTVNGGSEENDGDQDDDYTPMMPGGAMPMAPAQNQLQRQASALRKELQMESSNMQIRGRVPLEGTAMIVPVTATTAGSQVTHSPRSSTAQPSLFTAHRSIAPGMGSAAGPLREGLQRTPSKPPERRISGPDLAGSGIAMRYTAAGGPAAMRDRAQSITRVVALPPGWSAHAENGRSYYYNRISGQTSWNLDEVLRSHGQTVIPNQAGTHQEPGPSWKAVKTAQGKVYYYHRETRATTWRIEETWK